MTDAEYRECIEQLIAPRLSEAEAEAIRELFRKKYSRAGDWYSLL